MSSEIEPAIYNKEHEVVKNGKICKWHLLLWNWTAHFSPLFVFTKKGESWFVMCVLYGFLLIASRSTAPTTTIAMIMPASEGRKYISDSETGIGVGPTVEAGTSVTTA